MYAKRVTGAWGPGGFTLLETMIVLAIIGVLSSLAAATMSGVQQRAAPQNAAHDLYSTVARARARAVERGADVWVLVFPSVNKLGVDGAGGGAYFLYEDPDANFSSGGTVNYANFPTTGVTTPGENDKLLASVWLDDSPAKGALFGKPTNISSTGPFASISWAASGCTFCSGSPLRGAIVFNGDGAARFVDGDGATVSGRVAGLSIKGRTAPNAGLLLGVASATGFISSYR